MRLLSYAISGLRLYENHECRMDLYAIDAVREPGYTHMLDGAARNISINTAIGVAGINASGKTTALRVTELALAVAGGMSLGSLNPDLFPLYDTMDDRIGVRALFEQDGRFHLIDSLLERTGEGRTPLRFIRETLSIHHGKLSKKMLASAMNGTLDPERWTVLSSRNVGRPGVRGELSADAKRYLPPDRSICGAFVKDTDIATELLPVSPTLTVSPARPVVTLFDASIERLDYDKDGIHLKFRNEGKEREVTPNSLVIINEGMYGKYTNGSKRLKPSDYCKRELGMKQVKSRAWLERYWAASGFREPASCGAPADCQHGAHLVEDASLVLLRCLHVLIPESQGDLSLRRHADPVFHKTSQTGPVPFALIPDEAPLCTTRSKNVRHVAHAVKSRVRTIMLDRRVYRVAMQAKGGR